MSVSKKVLRRMKKVMGVIGAIPVLAACSSQISRANGEVRATFDYFTGTLRFSGDGVIDKSWQECYNKNFVKRVVIVDDGIEGIDTEAFSGCKSLEEITIPRSVTSIGNFAFSGCESLKEINIPNSITTIGDCAFIHCESLKEINIPRYVTAIAPCTFAFCRSLKEITIPNSVTSIGGGAFCHCRSLKEITIPSSVSSIGKWALYNCQTLESILFDNCGRGKDIVALNAFNVCSRELIESKKFSKNFYGNLKSNESGTLSSLLKKFLHGGKNVTIEEGAFEDCKMLGLIDTDGMVLNCHKDAFCGTPLFQNFGGKVICGKYHFPYHQDMVAKALLLDSINDRFNKNGEEKNPVDCPLRYPPFSHSCC